MKYDYSTEDLDKIEDSLDKFWFEKKDEGDFPLYNDKPFTLSWAKWIWWLVFTIGGFFVFTGIYLYIIQIFDKDIFNQLRPIFSQYTWLQYIFTILGYLMVIGSFWIVCKNKWNILFRFLSWKGVLFSAVFGLILFIISLFYYEFILTELFHLNLNNDSALNQDGKGGLSIIQAISILIQLIIEEFWAIVPFLFILTLCFKTFDFSRKTSLIIAWIISSIIFGAYHLPSYDNNFAQVFLVIAVDRIFITFVYIRYKNIWASYLTHVAWDIVPLIVVVVKTLMI